MAVPPVVLGRLSKLTQRTFFGPGSYKRSIKFSVPSRPDACMLQRVPHTACFGTLPRPSHHLPRTQWKCVHSLAAPLTAEEIFHQALSNQEFTDAEIDSIVKRMPALLDYSTTPDVNHRNEGSRLFNQIQTLRTVGLSTSAIKKLIVNFPHVLAMPDLGWIAGQIELLSEWFPKRDLEKMLEASPQILLEEWDDIRDRVYYAHYRMGLDQGDMQTANLLGHSYEHIKGRHILLCLVGRYIFPDKERMEGRLNPPLAKLLNSSDTVFAKKIAGIDVEEYHMFRKLYHKTIADRRDIAFFEEYPFPIRSVPRYNDVWSAKELVDEDSPQKKSYNLTDSVVADAADEGDDDEENEDLSEADDQPESQQEIRGNHHRHDSSH